MSIQVWIIGALVAVGLLGIVYIYNEGRDAGSSAVTGAVQSRTIEAIDAARSAKETADEEVRRTPYGDRVDGLR